MYSIATWHRLPPWSTLQPPLSSATCASLVILFLRVTSCPIMAERTRCAAEAFEAPCAVQCPLPAAFNSSFLILLRFTGTASWFTPIASSSTARRSLRLPGAVPDSTVAAPQSKAFKNSGASNVLGGRQCVYVWDARVSIGAAGCVIIAATATEVVVRVPLVLCSDHMQRSHALSMDRAAAACATQLHVLRRHSCYRSMCQLQMLRRHSYYRST